MIRRTLRRTGFLLLVPLVLLAADYVVWLHVTQRLRLAYLDFQAGIARQGWQAASDPPVATGWPIAATLRLDNLRLAQSGPDGAAQGGLGWAADQLWFGVSLLHPRRIDIVPMGQQVLTGLGWAPIRFRADRLRAEIPAQDPVQSATAEAHGLEMETDQGAAVADDATLDLSWQPDAAQLRLNAGPITLPAGHAWGLGQHVTTVGLDLIAHGAWPGSGAHAAAQAWRDGGGALDVTRIALQWATLDVAGSGHVVLDGDLQPDATLDLKVADPGAALATLADAGAISQGVARAGGAVLDLLAMPSRLAGQAGVLPLPLRLQGGVLTLGQIPLAKVPPLQLN